MLRRTEIRLKFMEFPFRLKCVSWRTAAGWPPGAKRVPVRTSAAQEIDEMQEQTGAGRCQTSKIPSKRRFFKEKKFFLAGKFGKKFKFPAVFFLVFKYSFCKFLAHFFKISSTVSPVPVHQCQLSEPGYPKSRPISAPQIFPHLIFKFFVLLPLLFLCGSNYYLIDCPIFLFSIRCDKCKGRRNYFEKLLNKGNFLESFRKTFS